MMAVAAPDQMAMLPPGAAPGQFPPVAASGMNPAAQPGFITDGHQLFVGALPQDITEEELRIVFGTYGTVRQIKVLTNMERSPAGSAFVFYETAQAAEDAITVLHEQYKIRATPDAKPIRVSWAKASKGIKGGGADITGGKGDSRGYKGCDTGKGKDSWAPAPVDSWSGDAWGKGAGKGGWDAWQGSWPQGGKDPWKGCGDAWNSGNGDAWSTGKGDAWNNGKGKGDAWSNGWQDPTAGGWDSWKGGGKDSWKGDGKGDWKGGGKDMGKSKGPKVPGDDPKRLYVGNLPADIDESSIRYVFGTYGGVEEVKIIGGRVEGRACAIVGMSADTGAQMAIQTLDRKYEIRPGEGPLQVRIADKSKSRVNNPY